jgi:hypothetical protein
MVAYGVYINHDIEIVITEKYIITFRRVRSQNALESCLLEKQENSSGYTCVAICRSSPATTIAFPVPNQWAFAFKGLKKNYANNQSLAERIGKADPIIQQCEDRIELIFPDGDTYSARKTETFRMSDLHPLPPSVNEGNLGECLQSWHMGCSEEIIGVGGKDSFVSVSISTKKHMYIFQMLPNDFYCRAARYNTCNSGVVFNQNFRQRNGKMSETYMADDNMIAGETLPIDPNFFGVCQIIDYGALMKLHLSERERSALCHRYGLNGFERKTQAQISNLLGISRSSVSRMQKKALKTFIGVIPKSPDNNIYWTVSSYTDTQIILNGCQGDVYKWNKPTR